MRKIKENREHCRFNLIEKRSKAARASRRPVFAGDNSRGAAVGKPDGIL
jgi:hypothetical protein